MCPCCTTCALQEGFGATLDAVPEETVQGLLSDIIGQSKPSSFQDVATGAWQQISTSTLSLVHVGAAPQPHMVSFGRVL